MVKQVDVYVGGQRYPLIFTLIGSDEVIENAVGAPLQKPMPQLVDHRYRLLIDLIPLEGAPDGVDLVGSTVFIVNLLLQLPFHEGRNAHLIDDHQDVLEMLGNEGELVDVREVLLPEGVEHYGLE